MSFVGLLELALTLAQQRQRRRAGLGGVDEEHEAVVALSDLLGGSGPGVELSHEELGLLVGLLIRSAGPGILEQYSRARHIAEWADMLARDSAYGDLAEAISELSSFKMRGRP